jgi:hypothetical protein
MNTARDVSQTWQLEAHRAVHEIFDMARNSLQQDTKLRVLYIYGCCLARLASNESTLRMLAYDGLCPCVRCTRCDMPLTRALDVRSANSRGYSRKIDRLCRSRSHYSEEYKIFGKSVLWNSRCLLLHAPLFWMQSVMF